MSRLDNRQRCIKCKYYGGNECPLMAGADVFNIDKCILDYDIDGIHDENSMEFFMINKNSSLLLQALGYKDKDNMPKVGGLVLTLRWGFGSCSSSRILYVSEEDDTQLYLSKGNEEFCVRKDRWYEYLFKLEDVSDEVINEITLDETKISSDKILD